MQWVVITLQKRPLLSKLFYWASSKDYLLNLFGDEKKIILELEKYKLSKDFIKITHTNSIISDEETPLTAIKNSKGMYGIVSILKSKVMPI